MNTHDNSYELPPLVGTLSMLPDHQKTVIEAYGRACARTAIEADRKRRGEPVGYFVNVNRYNGQKPQWEQLSDDYKDVDDAIPLYTAPQHAEPIVSDVEAIVRLLESREWAEHVATTPLGQRLETAVTVLVGADPQPSEPVKRKRRYAQGTALWEFGIIPMCDQVDDKPVKVPSDDLAHEIWAAAQTAPGEGIEDAVERVADLLASYGKGAP